MWRGLVGTKMTTRARGAKRLGAPSWQERKDFLLARAALCASARARTYVRNESDIIHKYNFVLYEP